ncbi:MAG: KH domain-containing protein [Candidatus Altiarchaeota archaeon]
MQYIKIPEERVGILLGENGSIKREIERKTRTKIKVDNCEVSIEGQPMDEWIAKDIVKAIARGFSPEKALKLLDENYSFEIIRLKDFANTEKELIRKKARVIGEHGKAREKIEESTDTYISIYGKTISIIGRYEDVEIAKEAIIKLLNGASHRSVYKFLEKKLRFKREVII